MRRYSDGSIRQSIKQSSIVINSTEIKVRTKTIEKVKLISFLDLFRFSTIQQRIFYVLGSLFIILSALMIPMNIVLYGEFTSLVVDRISGIGTLTQTYLLPIFGGGRVILNGTQEDENAALMDDAASFLYLNTIVAVVHFLFAFLAVDLANYSALKQITFIRKAFLYSVIRQDMAWYDTISDKNFAVKMTENLDRIKEGIGEKLMLLVFDLIVFFSGLVTSFWYGWKLTLIVYACAPIIVLSQGVVARAQSILTNWELKSYSLAGSVAEEVLSSIRTVVAFGGEKKELDRYSNRLSAAEQNGSRKGLFTGLGIGIMWLITYCVYAIALWYGARLIVDSRENEFREYTPNTLIIVLFTALSGAQCLGMTSPLFEAVSGARGAAVSIWEIIDRKSSIDPLNKQGLKPAKFRGEISFQNVHFHYPSRTDVKILQGLTLSMPAGKTLALVGPSGSGKSTVIQLIQRLYDPIAGVVKIDGIPVTQYNLNYLRDHFGIVGQEPTLFAGSIKQNIKFGKPDATDLQIEEAAKVANCYNFVMKFPKGFDTIIGERGAQLSGGQKQRIAIARAVVKNPMILLLDEATSALDVYSERVVQKALEKAGKGRTTIVVSHRLSTITSSDVIIFMDKGVVVERGSHTQLMAKRGRYFGLVRANQRSDEEDAEKRMIHQRRRKSIQTKEGKKLVEVDLDDDEVDDEIETPAPEAEELGPPTKIEKNLALKIAAARVAAIDLRKRTTSSWHVIVRLVKLNGREWPLIAGGCIAGVLNGATLPCFAILFGDFFGILEIPDNEAVKDRAIIYAIYFSILGLLAGGASFLQTYLLSRSGVLLTARLRKSVFQSILRQEMAWFDMPENSVGALTVRLSGDCANVQAATGSRAGSLIQSMSMLMIGFLVSLYYSWNLTLVVAISVPLVMLALMIDARYSENSMVAEKEAIQKASNIAVEAISNIRTVAGLCLENYIIKKYYADINEVERLCIKKSRFRGVIYATGLALPVLVYGPAFYYGAYLVITGYTHYQNILKISECLIFGSWMLGQALAYAPNMNLAVLSGMHVLQILDRKPLVMGTGQLRQIITTGSGIKFENVFFSFPARPKIPILRQLNLFIETGKTVALVGPSGSGKSTCLQLLLRFYDADSGYVYVNGKRTVDYERLELLRWNFGLVSQEPTLFDRTVAENIAYGDNSRQVSMAQIVQAAKDANIHEFISALPQGYHTSLGTRGGTLSGGQKQRIAIARALVRNPKILLLDEATSALDNQSERVVQEALDAARKGRTCITIAHRLSTIQNADLIYVMADGSVVEQGTHESLLRKGQLYAKLHKMQRLID